VETDQRRESTPGRTDDAAVYDPIGQRMLVIAGLGPRGDVWGLNLVGSPAWSQVNPGLRPGVGSFGFMVYDPKRTRMIYYTAAQFGAWSYSLLGQHQWTSIATGGPDNVIDAGIYDPIGDRVVVFGGSSGKELWQLSLTGTPSWSQFTALGPAPSPRNGHSVAYDASRHALIVFGGDSLPNVTPVNDAWSLSLGGSPAWTKIAATGGPSARDGAAIVYDPTRDRVTLFGGYNHNTGIQFGDTWILSLGAPPTWTQRSFTGATPPDDTQCPRSSIRGAIG